MHGLYYSATATAPLNVIETGLQAYIALGIEKSKLILGVPWYRKRISIVSNSKRLSDC